MEHAITRKVYYSDTDAFGVVWHGSYLKWLEMGRVEYCNDFGIKLSSLTDIILPVVELNIKYKNSAVLDDELTIHTEILERTKCSVTFLQKILNKEKTYIEATVKVVAVNKSGTLYRSLPIQLSKLFS